MYKSTIYFLPLIYNLLFFSIIVNVGNVSNFENKNNDNFEKDFQNYLDKYNIKKGLNIFEVNKYKNDKNLQKVFNSIKKKSNYPTKFCENCEAQKKKNLEKDISKEQLIKKVIYIIIYKIVNKIQNYYILYCKYSIFF